MSLLFDSGGFMPKGKKGKPNFNKKVYDAVLESERDCSTCSEGGSLWQRDGRRLELPVLPLVQNVLQSDAEDATYAL